MGEKDTSRRGYVKYAGGAVVAVAAGGIGYYAGTSRAPAPVTETITQTTGAATVTKTVGTTPTSAAPADADITDWLKKVSGPYAGATVNIITESTAPSQWLNEEKVAEFEELTGITINYELLGWDDVFAKSRLDGAQGTGTYDLYYIDEREIMAEYFENGYIRDLNEVTSTYSNLLWDGWNTADWLVTSYWTYKGMIAGAPFEHFLRMPIYRTDLFNDPDEKAAFKAKYGRDLAPGTTYDEVVEVAEFFTRPDDDIYGWNQQPATMSLPCDHYIGMMTYGLTSCGYSLGRRAAFKNGGMVDSPAGIAWLKRYKNLMDYCAPGIDNFTWDDEAATYSAGKVAYGWVWTENFAFIQDPEESPETAGKTWCAQPPYEPKYYREMTPTIYADSGVYALSTAAAEPEAAFLWQQFATSPKVQLDEMYALKGVCLRASQLYSSTADELDAKYKTNIYDAMKTARVSGYLAGPWPALPEEPTMRDILVKQLKSALNDEISEEDALGTAANDIDLKMKELGWPDLRGY
jgi:multiple sugar transport system substrate-binding protein